MESTVLKQRDAFIKEFISDDSFIDVAIFNGDTHIYSATTRLALRLTSDVGVVDYGLNPWHTWITPYFGVHLNWRYVSPDIPASTIPRGSTWHYIKRHLSTFVGLTVFSVQQPGKVENLFGKSALVVGMGYRLNDFLRVVAGMLVAKKNDPNPLIVNPRTACLPFIGLSFDSNNIFQSITSLLK
jgi:hypothetical protein